MCRGRRAASFEYLHDRGCAVSLWIFWEKLGLLGVILRKFVNYCYFFIDICVEDGDLYRLSSYTIGVA